MSISLKIRPIKAEIKLWGKGGLSILRPVNQPLAKLPPKKTGLSRKAKKVENIHAHGSHTGLGVNPSVLFIIADRLAQDEDNWKPFVSTAARKFFSARPLLIVFRHLIQFPELGNLDQLRMIVQGLHSVPLDREQPLWQFTIIEGVEDPAFGLNKGNFALYTKAYHASIDGVAGVSAMDILSNQEPTPRPSLPSNQVRLSKEEPGFFELLGGAYGKFAQHQFDMLKMSPAYVKALRKIVKNSIEDSGSLLDNLKPAPKTRFNIRIQKQRAFGAQSLPIKEVIGIAKATGTTLNDVVLAMCGGALRSYLIRHDELPKRALVAAVPVFLREVGDKSGANQVASINCEIGTDIEDPVARLKSVNKNAKRTKKSLAAIKDVFPKDYSFFGAPVMVSAMAQITSRTKLIDYMPAAMNVAISNVPGSRKPMYFAGSKAISNFPVSIATHGCALNITLTSYMDRLDFGLIACKIAVPDVQDIADDILAEFKLLKKAVAADVPKKPAPKKKATLKKKPASKKKTVKA